MNEQSDAVRADCMDTSLRMIEDVIAWLLQQNLLNSTGVGAGIDAGRTVVAKFGKGSMEAMVAIAGVAFITQMIAKYEISDEVEGA